MGGEAYAQIEFNPLLPHPSLTIRHVTAVIIVQKMQTIQSDWLLQKTFPTNLNKKFDFVNL